MAEWCSSPENGFLWTWIRPYKDCWLLSMSRSWARNGSYCLWGKHILYVLTEGLKMFLFLWLQIYIKAKSSTWVHGNKAVLMGNLGENGIMYCIFVHFKGECLSCSVCGTSVSKQGNYLQIHFHVILCIILRMQAWSFDTYQRPTLILSEGKDHINHHLEYASAYIDRIVKKKLARKGITSLELSCLNQPLVQAVPDNEGRGWVLEIDCYSRGADMTKLRHC